MRLLPSAPAIVVGLALFGCSACFPVDYLAQAGSGEAAMLSSARPLGRVLRDPTVPTHTRQLLFRVTEVEAFGRTHGLRPTRNYRRYADLPRSAAVWVVQACAPLSFDSKRWHFPIVGSVPYLGFFAEADAQRYGEQLGREEHLDVEVRPASAFSTLGWFSDPLLSTMLGAGEEAQGDLVDTILHESVHATVYLAGQSAFDESLASFIADRLTVRWFARPGANAAEGSAWTAVEARRAKYVAALHQAYEDLDAIYRSARSDAEKQSEKERRLSALRDTLGAKRTLNNAALAGYRIYDAGTPAFEHLLSTCGGDEGRMLTAVATLKETDFDRPQQEDFGTVIERLAQRGCPPADGSARGASPD